MMFYCAICVYILYLNPVTCLCLAPDGRLVSGSGDNSIKVWDFLSGECQLTLEGHSSGGMQFYRVLTFDLKIWLFLCLENICEFLINACLSHHETNHV